MHNHSESPPQVSVGEARPRVRGMAVCTILVAAAWAVLGAWLFREVGTLTLLWQAGEFLNTNERVQAVSKSAPTQAGGALSVLTFSAPRTLPSSDPAVMAEKRRLLAAYEQKVVLVEGTRHGWFLLTTLLIGVLAAGGVGLSLSGAPCPRASGALRLVSALALAASMFTLGLSVGMDYRGNWADTLVRLTQERDAWLRPAMLAAAAASGTLLLGLSLPRGPRAWMGLCIAIGLIGTMATLLAISLLIRAGLPPLPPWVYAVVALAQSLWSWVLLFALPSLRHDAPAATAV